MACVFLFNTDDAMFGPWPRDDGDAWLAPDEALRARNLADGHSRRRYTRSVFALRALLAQAGVPDIKGQPFTRGAHGKPRAVGGVHFSLARSHGGVMIGLSRDGPIGVDMEQAHDPTASRPGRLTANWPDRYPALAAQLSPSCLPFRGTALDRHRTFLRAWTRLEAQVKRDGQSLAQVLDDGVALTAPGLPGQLTDIDALPGFVGACALSRQTEVRVVMGRHLARPTS